MCNCHHHINKLEIKCHSLITFISIFLIVSTTFEHFWTHHIKVTRVTVFTDALCFKELVWVTMQLRQVHPLLTEHV